MPDAPARARHHPTHTPGTDPPPGGRAASAASQDCPHRLTASRVARRQRLAEAAHRLVVSTARLEQGHWRNVDDPRVGRLTAASRVTTSSTHLARTTRMGGFARESGKRAGWRCHAHVRHPRSARGAAAPTRAASNTTVRIFGHPRVATLPCRSALGVAPFTTNGRCRLAVRLVSANGARLTVGRAGLPSTPGSDAPPVRCATYAVSRLFVARRMRRTVSAPTHSNAVLLRP